ncbi:MAG: DUF4062 domain-containing protein [Ruminococcaceae bacterium]|nr:DUF4062 domain-containing protein [Oscillospiraceae bacterium]
MSKIYTAFISSAYESLKDERAKVINTLLDFRILPIGMEHFTVPSNGNFDAIKPLIDESDVFILLFGGQYGSCDSQGVSYTELEYDYALKKNKHIVAIACDEMVMLLEKNEEELTDDENKQRKFYAKSGMARKVSPDLSIRTIITQFLTTNNILSKCIGWTRTEDEGIDPAALEKWREKHKAYNFSGKWYHVHLSNVDEDYIRVGTITVEQDFTPVNYLKLKLTGKNYNVLFYDSDKKILYEDDDKYSRFTGEYNLDTEGKISGRYNSRRFFTGKFGSQPVNDEPCNGRHEFFFTPDEDEETVRLDGEYRDEAPSFKYGKLFIFRDINKRNEFLLSRRGDRIEKKKGE